jgi:hypothetical protein
VTRSSATSTRPRKRLSTRSFFFVSTEMTGVGDFNNAGREWRPKGELELVRTHDFKGKEQGTGQGDPVRHLRPRRRHGLVQRRHRQRYCPVRGREHPLMVGAPGLSALPERDDPHDHRPLQRQ